MVLQEKLDMKVMRSCGLAVPDTLCYRDFVSADWRILACGLAVPDTLCYQDFVSADWRILACGQGRRKWQFRNYKM